MICLSELKTLWCLRDEFRCTSPTPGSEGLTPTALHPRKRFLVRCCTFPNRLFTHSQHPVNEGSCVIISMSPVVPRVSASDVSRVQESTGVPGFRHNPHPPTDSVPNPPT